MTGRDCLLAKPCHELPPSGRHGRHCFQTLFHTFRQILRQCLANTESCCHVVSELLLPSQVCLVFSTADSADAGHPTMSLAGLSSIGRSGLPARQRACCPVTLLNALQPLLVPVMLRRMFCHICYGIMVLPVTYHGVSSFERGQSFAKHQCVHGRLPGSAVDIAGRAITAYSATVTLSETRLLQSGPHSDAT